MTNTNAISEAIRSFDKWTTPGEFEHVVLQTIAGADDQLLFQKMWATATAFNNWNHADLNTGIQKTTAMLVKEFELAEDVAASITNAAAYQWT